MMPDRNLDLRKGTKTPEMQLCGEMSNTALSQKLYLKDNKLLKAKNNKYSGFSHIQK